MPRNKSYSQNQLRDYSSLFSRNQAMMWFQSNFSSINYKIERYDTNIFNSKSATYLDYLKHIYRILESNYQNEYIFKNSFLNEWIINEIGQGNSTIFNEFRISKSIADLAMFNGTSKAFEIKTDLDSTKRLHSQLNNYKKVFNQIYLIIPESKLFLYQEYDKKIGIIIFKSCKKDKFALHREAIDNEFIENESIMNTLHTHEYKEIVTDYYGYLPKMTSFNQFNICGELISQIPNNVLNSLFIEKMKERNLDNIMSKNSHRELNQLSLAMKLNKAQRKSLIDKLKSPIKA